MLKQGMIERFRKAAPIIQELVDDLAWIQNEFNPGKATEEERKIDEVNTGVYIFKYDKLLNAIEQIDNNNLNYRLI